MLTGDTDITYGEAYLNHHRLKQKKKKKRQNFNQCADIVVFSDLNKYLKIIGCKFSSEVLFTIPDIK